MIGFLIGLACLWGLVRTLRGGCGWRRGGFHGFHGRSRFTPWPLRHLFQRLDTTEAQEREIRDATSEVRSKARELRDSLAARRDAVAQALRQDEFSQEALIEQLRAEEELAQMRIAFVAALGRVHATLDPDQRRRLARMISRGRRGFGPYREAVEL